MSKFLEGLNTSVFTTKYVIEDNSCILHVFHYEDGSWQFSGSQQGIEESDYRIVSLGEILLIDHSLEELANMPIGYEAERSKKGDQWRLGGFHE